MFWQELLNRIRPPQQEAGPGDVEPDVTPEQISAEVERQLREVPGFRDLLLGWGIDLVRNDRVAVILRELRSNVRIEIPDFPAFRDAVRVALTQEPGFDVPNRPLLEQVAAIGDNHGAVLALLNRDPVGGDLPFIEKIPLTRHGQITWKAPVSNVLVCKSVRDPIEFLEAVKRLRETLRDPAMDAAFERIERLAVQRPRHLGLAVHIIEERLAERDSRESSTLAGRRTEHLRRVLRDLLAVSMRPQPSRDICSDGLAACADMLESAYLWTDSLRNLALICLLSEEMIRRTENCDRRAGNTLAIIRDEVAAGHYSPEVLSRRLRSLEEAGLYVSSLAFAILARSEEASHRPATPARRPA